MELPDLRGQHVILRPIADDDVPLLRAIRETPEVMRWWGELEPDFPLGDEPETTRFTVWADGAVVGMVQYGEEPEPDYRHAWIDIFLSPTVHGRGYGRDAVRAVARHLMDDRGHHRVTIDPALANAAAVRAYERAGFQRVGVMRKACRNPLTKEWEDALFLELVRDDA